MILFRFLILLLVFIQPASAANNDEAFWSALKSGKHVVLIRHAITEPGIGDPPGFVQGDCTTQRNLSAQGRNDAQRIGEAFRSRNIPVAEVLSSRWCRCLDTANLAFGKATPAPMLDSMFNDKEKPGEEKLREVYAAVNRRPSSGTLVLVTHHQNIQALTGDSVGSGEMVVVTPEAGKLRVLGRLNLSGS
jgi:phosphohistidine phosphatase SixA